MISRALLYKTLLVVVLLIVLAAAFAAYLQPGFILDLANRFVLC